MKAIKYLSCILLLFLTSRIYSQIPDTVWTKTFGGPLADIGNSVRQTTDGGLIIAATTSSFGAGGQDIWLIKTDENGDTLWTKTFGGNGNDRTANVVQTNDNGYAIFGTTNSYGNGGDDFLLWKTDSLGNTEWFRTYGASTDEQANDGMQTIDGCYIIVGDSLGQDDHALAIKADEFGNELWSTKIGNTDPIGHHFGNSVQQTNNGEYYIAGNYVYYYFPYYNIINYFLSKLNSDGELMYVINYSYNNLPSSCHVVKNLTDGNLLLGGYTDMSNTRPWILKITPNGSIIWQKILAGVYLPLWLTSLEPTLDNGFIITAKGSDNSIRDFHILKADEEGNLQWEELIGGTSIEDPSSICQTSDGGYIVTGYTKSFGAGDSDIWLLKFKYNPSPEIQISKDSLNLTFDNISYTSQDSLVIYNTGNAVLNVDTIYSKNASGFLLDIFLKDTTIHTAVTWRNNYYDPFEIEPDDSAKLIFTYPLWVPKNNNITETWQDTIIILNNSVNNSILAIPALIDFPVGIGNENNNLPLEFSLQQNYPNPFNPTTKIKFTIPGVETRHALSLQMVTLKVYDLLGNEVITLVNEEKQPGTYEVEFDGTNFTSGIYFYQLKVGNFIETKKMVLIK